jgi:thymidine kinase
MNKLYFYYGVMGSAKTTSLLTTNYALNKRTGTILLSPKVDTRREARKIKSRVGIEASCTDFKENDNLYDMCVPLSWEMQASVILVDEAQFLKKEQVDQLAMLVDKCGYTVMCYGLKSDFRGELFEGSKRLLELADKIEEIKTNCSCGRKATMNARIIDGKIVKEGPQVLIGDTVGGVRYEAKCRKCWK